VQLKKIEIGRDTVAQNGYKNLIDFKLDFATQDGLTILIGNNGSGKSNLLEAISLIFYKLYNDDLDSLTFKFLIEYEKNNTNIKINNIRSLKFRVDNIETTKEMFYTSLNNNTPDKIFTIYSGEELRLWEECYFVPYRDYYMDVIRNNSSLDSLKMNYVNKYFWNIAILLLYIKDEHSISAILNGCNIEKIMLDIHTTNLDNFHRNSPNNITRVFKALEAKLDGDKKISFEDFKTTRYINEYGDDEEIISVLQELYYILLVALLPIEDSYKTLKKIDIEFDNSLKTSDFSEGQKKEILITFITEVLASQNSLFLLDEPDSHIHPIKKLNLINILKNSDTKSIIMTTHSPTLIREIETKHLVLMQNGKANDTDKIDLLKEITNGRWAIDSLNNVLIANKNILLVEGKTDIEYIEIALSKLREYPTYNKKYKDLDFTIIPTGGASGLVNFVDKFTASENQKIIALLDRDTAGKNSFRTVFGKTSSYQLTQNDMTQEHIKNNIKIYFLPTNRQWNKDFEIEDYFRIDRLKNFGRKLYKDKTSSITQLKQFIDIKEHIKKELPTECLSFRKEDFRDFKQLFDLLLSI
jgi:predicted ATPase